MANLLIFLNKGDWTIYIQPLKLHNAVSVHNFKFSCHTFDMLEGQGQLRKLGKLATFAC